MRFADALSLWTVQLVELACLTQHGLLLVLEPHTGGMQVQSAAIVLGGWWLRSSWNASTFTLTVLVLPQMATDGKTKTVNVTADAFHDDCKAAAQQQSNLG